MSDCICVAATSDTGSVAKDAVNEASLANERRDATASPRSRPRPADRGRPSSRLLDPESLHLHIDRLYRAARALCGSPHEAEDLVQETFVNVLKRPRLLRDDNEIGYLLRALRNTYSSRYRSSVQRRRDRGLTEDDGTPRHDDGFATHEIMEAVASAPAAYRDAVIAVDLIGLSYREAAAALNTRESTITTRLHRGRQHIARALKGELEPEDQARRLAA